MQTERVVEPLEEGDRIVLHHNGESSVSAGEYPFEGIPVDGDLIEGDLSFEDGREVIGWVHSAELTAHAPDLGSLALYGPAEAGDFLPSGGERLLGIALTGGGIMVEEKQTSGKADHPEQ